MRRGSLPPAYRQICDVSRGATPAPHAQKWRFDPKLSDGLRPANRYACRGVTYWLDDSAPPDAACRSRIFTGTNDARLIALDALTGQPCGGFGVQGEVKLDTHYEKPLK